MIYSLYDLWERRQIDLIDALLIGRTTGNLDAIYDALRHTSTGVGFWDDSVSTPSQNRNTLCTALAMPTIETAFVSLVGFQPEFNIRSIEQVMHSAPTWMNSDSKPYLFAPQNSVSDSLQITFAPLPDPDPASVPREKNYKAWIVFGIIAAIVIAALFFFV